MTTSQPRPPSMRGHDYTDIWHVDGTVKIISAKCIMTLTVTDAVAKTNLVHIVPLTTIDQRFTRIQIGLTEKN